MSANDLEENLQRIKTESLSALQSCESLERLEELRVRILGRKGQLTEILMQLKDLAPEVRKIFGQKSNELKVELEQIINEKKSSLEFAEINRALSHESFDASLPGVYQPRGALHPIRIAMEEAVRILEKIGLRPVYGPEVEYEDFNFDRLNFKEGHPARDMQATFYVENPAKDRSWILRTHTSPLQVRVLLDLAKKNHPLPIRIQAPGRVYRVDDDATHSPMFHQIEGFAVDRRSGMGDLRAVVDYFMREFFGGQTKIRFRPSFFPFTEPSAEVDISCVFCGGKGCRVCKTSGWLEVAGAGLIHPEVLRLCEWDPHEVQGWAFGFGVERMAMLKLGVPDLRSFYENRLSFLRGDRL